LTTTTIVPRGTIVNEYLGRLLPVSNDEEIGADELAAFARRLREQREARGLTRDQLSERSGINASQLRGYETGSSGRYPRVPTLRRLASALNTTVAYLIGDAARPPLPALTRYDRDPQIRALVDSLATLPLSHREEVTRHTLWSIERVVESERRKPEDVPQLSMWPIADVIEFPHVANGAGDFPMPPIPLDEWIEKDTDTPRPLHAWVVPVDAEAAAGLPRHEDDWLIPTTQLLNSVREVRDDRTKVVKVFGDSMHPVLRNGWKVLLDPARSLFRPGKIVVVYVKDEGITLGLLANEGERYWIQKRNPNYGGPTEIHLRTGEWYPVGTVTTIVEAPVEIE
jgi:transcriptional regulator with XRE-family HTH domain